MKIEIEIPDEELKAMVRRYRLAYQKMKAIEKELKFQGDF